HYFLRLYDRLVPRLRGHETVLPPSSQMGTVHQVMSDVLDAGFVESWTQKMRAGDWVVFRYTHEVLNGKIPKDKLVEWMDLWVNRIPKGVRLLIFEHPSAVDAFPQGLAAYLVGTQAFRNAESQLFPTPEHLERWRRINANPFLRTLDERIPLNSS